MSLKIFIIYFFLINSNTSYLTLNNNFFIINIINSFDQQYCSCINFCKNCANKYSLIYYKHSKPLKNCKCCSHHVNSSKNKDIIIVNNNKWFLKKIFYYNKFQFNDYIFNKNIPFFNLFKSFSNYNSGFTIPLRI